MPHASTPVEEKLKLLSDMVGDPDEEPKDPDLIKAVAAQQSLEEEISSAVDSMRLGQVPSLPADTKNDRARIVRLLATVEDSNLPATQREAVSDYLHDLIRRRAGLRFRKRN